MATVTHATREDVICRVRAVRRAAPHTVVVQLERPTINFDAGQYVSVGFPEKIDMREYSVYSGPDDDVLEVLVRRVDGGLVSPQLVDLEPGDRVRVEGPFGFFTIPEENRSERFLWVSTGTGIAPFRSFVRAYPDLDYTLLHGVRRMVELYDWSEYEPDRKVACVSREEGGDFRGRVTDYLRGHPPSPETQCYLCGNAAMIYEVYDILQNQGVDTDRIHAEVYF